MNWSRFKLKFLLGKSLMRCRALSSKRWGWRSLFKGKKCSVLMILFNIKYYFDTNGFSLLCQHEHDERCLIWWSFIPIAWDQKTCAWFHLLFLLKVVPELPSQHQRTPCIECTNSTLILFAFNFSIYIDACLGGIATLWIQGQEDSNFTHEFAIWSAIVFTDLSESRFLTHSEWNQSRPHHFLWPCLVQ